MTFETFIATLSTRNVVVCDADSMLSDADVTFSEVDVTLSGDVTVVDAGSDDKAGKSEKIVLIN